MTPEEKARECIAATFEDLPADCIPAPEVTHYLTKYFVNLYLAGHAEAMRWRDPVTEPPLFDSGDEAIPVLIDVDLPTIEQWTKNNSGERYERFQATTYGKRGFNTYFRVRAWRPIGPLPEVKV